MRYKFVKLALQIVWVPFEARWVRLFPSDP